MSPWPWGPDSGSNFNRASVFGFSEKGRRRSTWNLASLIYSLALPSGPGLAPQDHTLRSSGSQLWSQLRASCLLLSTALVALMPRKELPSRKAWNLTVAPERWLISRGTGTQGTARSCRGHPALYKEKVLSFTWCQPNLLSTFLHVWATPMPALGAEIHKSQ